MNRNIGVFIASIVALQAVMAVGVQHAHADTKTDNDINLTSIAAGFCNGDSSATDTLKMTMSPGEEKEICVELENQSAIDIPMQLNFVDGAFTSNTNQQSCMRETDVEKFGNYVTWYESIVNVPAWEKIQVKAKVKFWKNKVWKVLGCLTYRTASTDNKTFQGMSVIVRKARLIDIFVAGNITADLQYILPENAKYVAKTDKLMVTKNNGGGVNVWLWFYNAWDLEENVTVSGTMRDTFGKTIIFSDTVKTILAEKKDLVAYNIPQLARYKMRFTVDLTVTHQPKIDGIDPQYLSESVRSARTDNFSITFFIFPWRIVILLGIILGTIIIWKYLHDRAKQHAIAKEAELEEFMHRKQEHEQHATTTTPPSSTVIETQSAPLIAEQTDSQQIQMAPSEQIGTTTIDNTTTQVDTSSTSSESSSWQPS